MKKRTLPLYMVLPTGLLLAGAIPSTAFTTAYEKGAGALGDTLRCDTAATDTSLYNKQMQLGEVTVSAQRPLVTTKIDRVAYDIQHDEESKTKNVLEMLRKVPYVSVDGMDNITIKGSSNFKIYKNGHEDPAFSGQSVSQVLKSIPANTIKRIEVITDPGAREDAEGAKTILNIVTMDNSGLAGYTATINTGIDWYGSHADGVNLITQIGKWTWSVNYTFFHDTPQSKTIRNRRRSSLPPASRRRPHRKTTLRIPDTSSISVPVMRSTRSICSPFPEAGGTSTARAAAI